MVYPRLVFAPVTLLATVLTRVTPPLLRQLVWPGATTTRTCVACGDPIRDGDAFLRYWGEYYHAATCLEDDPPALRREELRESQLAQAQKLDR